MAETKIYIPDSLDAQRREAAMRKFGYGRGSISRAVEYGAGATGGVSVHFFGADRMALDCYTSWDKDDLKMKG
jgi:hypothetical protein